MIGGKFTRFQLLLAWFGTQKQYLNLVSKCGISKKIALALSHQKSLVQICCPRFWRWNLCRWPRRYAWRVDAKEGHSSSDSRGSVSCHSAAGSQAALAAMVIQWWDYRWRMMTPLWFKLKISQNDPPKKSNASEHLFDIDLGKSVLICCQSHRGTLLDRSGAIEKKSTLVGRCDTDEKNDPSCNCKSLSWSKETQQTTLI